MHNATIATLVPWLIAHGYAVFFIAALIEGSLVSTAAGVVAALGFFNIFTVIFISLMGDVVGDLIYYGIGYKIKNSLNSKFLKYLGVTEERVQKTRELLHTHVNKSLILIKLSPFLGPPGLLIVGAVHVPFKKYFKTIVTISLIKALFFSLLGYFSGVAYLTLSKTVSSAERIIVPITIFIFLVYFLYKLITDRIVKKFQ